MNPTRRAVLGAALGTGLLGMAGCATQTNALRTAAPAGLPRRVELAATPFFPQTEYHCGPAALATVLGAAGRRVEPAALGAEIFLPARTGTLQIEMVGGARRHGLVATRTGTRVEAVLREAAAGTPLVVLQNLGLSWYPLWHYAVVIGYDLDDGVVLLRSGTTERLALAMSTFEHTWTRAGSWAIAALPPGRWPATASEAAVVEAAVGFERAAAPRAAIEAYRSALERHPGQLTLTIALGNARYASGDRPGAAAAFRDAAQRHPGNVPAWLNLGSTLLELGDAAGAREAAQRAVELADAAYDEPARTLLARARTAEAQTKDSSSRR